jgi:lysozyme
MFSILFQVIKEMVLGNKPAITAPIIKPEDNHKSSYPPSMPQCGIDLIKSVESLRLEAYLDQRGIPTIGYGHTLGVKITDTCTPFQADLWLRSDLTWAWSALLAHVKITLTQNQWGALLSFVFNLGETNFLKSGVYRALAKGDTQSVPRLMKEWDKTTIHGELVSNHGLANRRAKEAALWIGADWRTV